MGENKEILLTEGQWQILRQLRKLPMYSTHEQKTFWKELRKLIRGMSRDELERLHAAITDIIKQLAPEEIN